MKVRPGTRLPSVISLFNRNAAPRTTTLDECATALAGLGQLPNATCRSFVTERCAERVTTSCPAGSVRTCADVASGQLVVHALEQTEPSPQELDEIRRLIDAYRSRREEPS